MQPLDRQLIESLAYGLVRDIGGRLDQLQQHAEIVIEHAILLDRRTRGKTNQGETTDADTTVR